ncbi:MAG: alpha/beta hydrolase [Pseudomonadota bacterium]
MYLVTNRALDSSRRGLNKFLSTSGQEGALNLRIVEIAGTRRNPTVAVLDDQLSAAAVRRLNRQHDLNLDPEVPQYQSVAVACELFARARAERKHILFYVHGYNNDVSAVVDAARELEANYPELIVVPFSWPAKGGGSLSGTANYLDDKRDARASSGALDRVFGIVRRLHLLLTEAESRRLWTRTLEKYPDNPERAREHYVALQSRVCRVTLNLLCHSMGNYVLKYAAIPSETNIRRPVFDNVCLVAADCNNHDHVPWLGEIDCRGGVYVVINEDDYALRWSRIKPGEEQQRRLGHYLKNLAAPNAIYVDLTRAPGVGESHGYFKGEVIRNSAKLRRFFNRLFTGEHPERYVSQLKFDAGSNAYRLK